MRLERFGVKDRAPRAIVSHLRDGEQGLIPETPKPDDPLFQAVFNMVIGGNRTAQDAAVVELIRHGIVAKAHPSPVIGEARTAGETIAAIIRQEKNRGPRGCASCMVFGGETTVSVQGSGKGGRNQELALAAAVALEGVPDVLVLTLATDGKDGPTDAAGAAVTGETLKRAQDLGLNATQHLGENNSHAFFNSLSDLLVTGPTETNAADLTFAFY
jgi:hydroxypyruvate reductase